MNPWSLPAETLRSHFAAGTLSPVDVTQAVLARLDAVQPRLNAMVARRDADALAEARAAEARWRSGSPRSPLDGVPFTVKDSLAAHGLPTTWGTAALRDWHAPHEELAVTRARAAGLVLLGKTNLPEFALEGYTANAQFGTTRNPWNAALTPGGSSGGAVAAVAAGIGPLAIGQDGGGSIRRPAGYTGLVGLKPSLGAVPRAHTQPSLLLDFECTGPIGRTVADTAALFALMAGPHPDDRASLAAATAAAQQGQHMSGPLRVRYVERMGAAPLDPSIAAATRQAVQRLSALGHHVAEGPLPLALDDLLAFWPSIGPMGLAALFEQQPGWGEAASPRYRQMAEEGRRLPAARLWQLLEQVRDLRRAADTLFHDIDLIVTPAAAAMPWPADVAWPDRIDGQPVGPRGHSPYTGWVNAAGLPGLVLPAEPSADGLPIGWQLVGPYGADALLLRVAAEFEAAHPWSHRWPTCA